MPKEKKTPYRGAAWVEPFEFSDNIRQELQARLGLSMECVSGIERAIEDERAVADILSGEPSVAQVEAALEDGAAAAANLLKWLAQVDDKTKSVIELSNFQRTGKFLSGYKPAIKELTDSIWLALRDLPEKKRGRRPAKLSLRLAAIIADAIEKDGGIVDDKENGLLCQTLGLALSAIGKKRSQVRDIVSKTLNERGN